MYIEIKSARLNEGIGWFIANDEKPRIGVQCRILLVKVFIGHKSKRCQNDDQQLLILSKETDSTTKVD